MWKILIDILHVLARETVEYVIECSYILMSSVKANTIELANANKFTMLKKKDALTDVQGWYSAKSERKKQADN